MVGKSALRGIVRLGSCQFSSMLLLDIWGWSFGGPGCLQTALGQDWVKGCVSKYIWIYVRSVIWGAHGRGIRFLGTYTLKCLGSFLTGKTTLNHGGEWLKPISGTVSVNATGSETGRSEWGGMDEHLSALVEEMELRTVDKGGWV